MTKKFKPFRLINTQELNDLEQHFNNRLIIWNDIYALIPLSLTLRNHYSKNNCFSNFLIIKEEGQPIALINKNLKALTWCLFGDLSSCFNAITKRLLQTLMQQLFDVPAPKEEIIASNPPVLSQWFYHGSTTLEMTLTAGNAILTFYIHPQMILNLLPKPKRVKLPKINLQETLGDRSIECHVELPPLTLKIKDSIQLQVGDVIKTEHRLSQPLVFKQQQKTLYQVELGLTNHHKSIQLVSSL